MLTSYLERYVKCQVKAHGCPDLAAVERLDPDLAPIIKGIWDRVVEERCNETKLQPT